VRARAIAVASLSGKLRRYCEGTRFRYAFG
jgi:hypothetical protein